MPISQDHHDLFQSSAALDKIRLFQTLLDSEDLTSTEALALLNSIHTELESAQGHDPAIFRQYAEAMESLRLKMPNIHKEVAEKWSDLQYMHQLQQKQSQARSDDDLEDEEPGELHRSTIKRTATVESRMEPNRPALPVSAVKSAGLDDGHEEGEEGEEMEEEEERGEDSEVEETEKESEEELDEDDGEGEESEKEEKAEEEAEEGEEEKEEAEEGEEIEEEKEEESEAEESEELESEGEKEKEVEPESESETVEVEEASEAEQMAGEAAEAAQEAESEGLEFEETEPPVE